MKKFILAALAAGRETELTDALKEELRAFSLCKT